MTQEFTFERWRHGGWYVNEVRYPSGAVGCVSRNYADKKWRIVCDRRPNAFDITYPSRQAAAQAEYNLARAECDRAATHARCTTTRCRIGCTVGRPCPQRKD